MRAAGLLATAALPLLVAGHGSVVHPPSRNAVDRELAPWNGSVPVSSDGAVAFDPWCPVPSADAPSTAAGKLSGRNGQACFWFSSGCSIGCNKCDGTTRGPIPNIPCTRPGDKSEMCARKMEVCSDGRKMPSLPREARTVNTDKADGAADDWYQFSPWRAPGSAGVLDPCGTAGGTPRDSGRGKYDIHYANTTHAKSGDSGSALPMRDAGVVWTAGDVVEVSWSISANHGGGYYWRLCKLPEDGTPVTEACFQLTPLQFVGNTRFRWNGDRSSEEEIDTVLVSTGTTPPGSTWAMNPIPRNDTNQTGASFAPKCKETCTGCMGENGGACATCRCTGMWGPFNLEIVDHVALPWMLPAGDYVVGWRWDTEESNQVWNACSDVTIKAHPKKAEFGGAFGRVPCPLAQGLCLGDTVKPPVFPNKSLPLNATLEYARGLLQSAIMVEHSTIPLYLSSLWSIQDDGAQEASDIIHSVVIEEMLHMTIAANAMNAIGGAPNIDHPAFIPQFPLNLPLTNVSVDIQRFDMFSIQNFMLIESTTELAKSIGGAYEYVLSILQELCDRYGEPAVFIGNVSYQIAAQVSQTQTAPKILNMSNMIEALLGVSEQGGGCPVAGKEGLWPNVANISSGPLGGVLSHFARFSEIRDGRRYRNNDTIEGGPTGDALPTDWVHVYDFEANPKVDNFKPGSQAYNMSLAFAAKYTGLLAQLHDVFNGRPDMYYPTLGAMHSLTVASKTLLTTPDPRKPATSGWGLGPPWQYVAAASRWAARGGRPRPVSVA